jgi:hypothetical protein
MRELNALSCLDNFNSTVVVQKNFGHSGQKQNGGRWQTSSIQQASQDLPAGLSPEVQASYRRWWAHMVADSAGNGDGMVVPDFVADFVTWLHKTEPKGGAVLVFLSGFDDIKRVYKGLEERRLPGARLIMLHGSMPTVSQQEIFERPPQGTRKIVLATNIAETSITIDDVTVVVDCGVHMVMSYDPLNNIRELFRHWCAETSGLHTLLYLFGCSDLKPPDST